MAAELVTPEAINFMAKYGRGLICLSLTGDRLRELEIPMMVEDNTSPRSTAFTVSIEARKGVTTGISAADRARTIQVAVGPDTGAADLSRPGHVFPLRAVDGGVLVRTGHTEGSLDLARLAGLTPAGVICEVMRDDGEMARMPDLLDFAEAHGLPVVSIADLVQYRLERDSLVERMTSAPLESKYGRFELVAYRSLVDGAMHYAVVAGKPEESDEPVLVRVQNQCMVCDVFGSRSCTRGQLFEESLRQIAEAGTGVLLYLRFAAQDRVENMLGQVAGRCNARSGGDGDGERAKGSDKFDVRRVGVGSQILRDLGVGKMRLITTKPIKIAGLAGFGLDVVEQIWPSGELDENGGLRFERRLEE
jgi:3,4-dihydroxy 2-butanone 4-phosphate synthase/GTP cyclohydrolase II